MVLKFLDILVTISPLTIQNHTNNTAQHNTMPTAHLPYNIFTSVIHLSNREISMRE